MLRKAWREQRGFGQAWGENNEEEELKEGRLVFPGLAIAIFLKSFFKSRLPKWRRSVNVFPRGFIGSVANTNISLRWLAIVPTLNFRKVKVALNLPARFSFKLFKKLYLNMLITIQ